MAGRVYSSWNPLREPFDFYILCGQVSPGIATVQGMNQPRRINELMAPGNAGATCFYMGWKPSHFSIKHILSTEQDWDDWATFKTLLKLPAYRQQSKALDFWHPFGDLFDPPIRAVIVEDILQPETLENGSESIEVKYAQFTKPKLQFSKPDGAKDKPMDEEERAIWLEQQNTRNKQAIAADLEKKANP